tara:strand:+ start:828 stop:1712 length:885 start_codon:yes stop_codon:yes gene_type:complete
MSSNSSNASARRRRAGVPLNSRNESAPVQMTPVSLLQQHNFRLSKIEQTIEKLMNNNDKSEELENLQDEIIEQRTMSNYKYHTNNFDDVQEQNNVFEKLKKQQAPQQQAPQQVAPQQSAPQQSAPQQVAPQQQNNQMLEKKIADLEQKMSMSINNTTFSTFEKSLPIKMEQLINSKIGELKLDDLKKQTSNVDVKKIEKQNEELKQSLEKLSKEYKSVKDMFESQHKLVNSQQETINKMNTMLVEYLESKNQQEREEKQKIQEAEATEARSQQMVQMMEMLQSKKNGTIVEEDK